MLESDEFYNNPIRPVSEDEWPYECIPKHGSIWIIGETNPKWEVAEWCKKQQLEDHEFEWKFVGSKKYPAKPVPPDAGEFFLSMQRVQIGCFYYFKRPQDAMIFKLTWC